MEGDSPSKLLPSPPPFLHVKDVNLNGEYRMKLLILVG
jgi:hypothetical protein